uniref:Uncharacterized protein n=1 Tax=Caenorhabditis tropicalis TaxID=1561998 RepID=A0A1I7TX22_9PELO
MNGVAVSTHRRTQAIKRNLAAARNVVQPVRTVVQRRPVSAPVRTIVQHVQPAPVRVIRQVITAPPVETHVIRRGPPSQQVRRNFPEKRRNVVVQQVQQYAQVVQRVIQAPALRRCFQQQQQRFVIQRATVLNDPPIRGHINLVELTPDFPGFPSVPNVVSNEFSHLLQTELIVSFQF